MERLNELFVRHLENELTTDEQLELMGLFLEPALQPQIKKLVEQAWTRTGEEQQMSEEKKLAFFEQVFSKQVAEEAPVIEMYSKKGKWKRRIIAASVIALLGVGSYFIFFGKTDKAEKPIVVTTKDIEAPKSAKAMITLADGRIISLDSVINGTLAVEGAVNVIKTADDQVIYNGSSDAVLFNTLYNPRGSKVVNLTLQDGTKVWLNSESSLRYPTSFTGNERKVEITGEAYFEVSKDPARKFLVSSDDITIEVLGTHFNINSYTDENNSAITLLEGSVKVTKGNSTGVLKPGQQAEIRDGIKIIGHVDTDGVMAWKNGYFAFAKSDLKTVMRQIARWYDVEVYYEGQVADRKFGGEISRSGTISQVLKILQESNVSFKIEGRKITITNK